MSETLLAILTDPNARRSASVKANLSQEFSAGKAWFDKNADN